MITLCRDHGAILVVDESHVTVPQLGAMYKGDFARKSTLAEYGFRLPSCLDNRPLKFEEWEAMRPETVFVSATPGPWELGRTQGVVAEQLVRPTGLIDPICIVRPTAHQVDDLIAECRDAKEKGQRVLVTVLTKKMAEDKNLYGIQTTLALASNETQVIVDKDRAAAYQNVLAARTIDF